MYSMIANVGNLIEIELVQSIAKIPFLRAIVLLLYREQIKCLRLR